LNAKPDGTALCFGEIPERSGGMIAAVSTRDKRESGRFPPERSARGLREGAAWEGLG
jgi:hypothetical protein